MVKNARFALNLIVVFLATLWVPILNITTTDAEGAAVQHRVPMYACYQNLFSQPDPWFIGAVVIHLLVVVGVSLAVRRMLNKGEDAAAN